MKRHCFWFLIAATACTASEETIIRQAEAKLVLPSAADPLSHYDRYYVVSGRTATGIFIWSKAGQGKMVIVPTQKDLPFVADGGCGVIQVRLDLSRQAWDRPFCHGN